MAHTLEKRSRKRVSGKPAMQMLPLIDALMRRGQILGMLKSATVRDVIDLAYTDPSCIPILADLLNNIDPFIRDEIVKVFVELARWVDIRVVDGPLLEVLNIGSRDGKESAAKALIRIYLFKEEGGGITRLLRNGDATIRVYSTKALKSVASMGGSITFAICALAGVAYKPTDDNSQIKALAGALNDPDVDVRIAAETAFGNLALQGRGIAAALVALAKALRDTEDIIREGVASTLRYALKDGHNTTEAISTLTDMLEDENTKARGAAAEMLALHYIVVGGNSTVKALLSHTDSIIRRGAIDGVWHAAESRMSITHLVTTLAKALDDSDAMVRRAAVSAFLKAAEKGESITVAVPMLAAALKDGDEPVKVSAIGALSWAAWYGQDITAAISSVCDALKYTEDIDPFWTIRMDSVDTLESAAVRGDKQTRERITVGVHAFVASDHFANIAGKNNSEYIEFAEALGKVMSVIRRLDNRETV